MEKIYRKLWPIPTCYFLPAGASLHREEGAIAAIACGLPIVAYSKISQGPPLSEAGVVLSQKEKIEWSCQEPWDASAYGRSTLARTPPAQFASI